jgi:leucyl-tRNA synthetase
MQEALEAMVLALAPIVPHITDSLWQALGHPGAVIDARWPKADDTALVRSTLDIVLQVNGKLRGKLSVAAGTPNGRAGASRAGRRERAEIHGRKAGEESDRGARQARERGGLTPCAPSTFWC